MPDPKNEKKNDRQPNRQPPPPRPRPTGEPARSAAKPQAQPAAKPAFPAGGAAAAPRAPAPVATPAAPKPAAPATQAPPAAPKPGGAVQPPAATGTQAPLAPSAAPAATPQPQGQPPEKKAPPAPAKRAERRKAKKTDGDQLRLKKEEQARRTHRRNRQLIGVAISILVVVGAVSIVLSGIGMARQVFDSTGEIDEYQNRFKAFVWFYVQPFESITQVDENTFKQAIIWSIFDDQMADLARNDIGEALVPASEVDRYGARVFGPDFRFSTHETFRDQVQQLQYNFDAEARMYAVPNTGLNPDYLPTVVDVVREAGGVRRVVVGYVSTRGNENQVLATPDYDHPAMYMDYLLQRDGSDYYLYAIRQNTTYAAEIASEPASPPASPAAPSVPESLSPPGAEVSSDD